MLRFGLGLAAARMGERMRRDRMLLVGAFATAFLTLPGAVGGMGGMDRLPNSGTGTPHAFVVPPGSHT